MKKTLTWLVVLAILGGLGAAVACRAYLNSQDEAGSRPKGPAAIAIEAVLPEHG